MNDASSVRVARVLIRSGWQQVYPLEGGSDAWLQAGYPVEPRQRYETDPRRLLWRGMK